MVFISCILLDYLFVTLYILWSLFCWSGVPDNNNTTTTMKVIYYEMMIILVKKSEYYESLEK